MRGYFLDYGHVNSSMISHPRGSALPLATCRDDETLLSPLYTRVSQSISATIKTTVQKAAIVVINAVSVETVAQ